MNEERFQEISEIIEDYERKFGELPSFCFLCKAGDSSVPGVHATKINNFCERMNISLAELSEFAVIKNKKIEEGISESDLTALAALADGIENSQSSETFD